LSYELRVKGVHPGTARLRVDATSRGQTKAVLAEQTTEILRPN
jgi:16S rRNA G966 N2-methylase RsmD